MELFKYHDSGIIVLLIQFFNHLLHYHGFHHILFIADIISVCKKQIDIFPRNSELTKAVHVLIQALADEGSAVFWW